MKSRNKCDFSIRIVFFVVEKSKVANRLKRALRKFRGDRSEVRGVNGRSKFVVRPSWRNFSDRGAPRGGGFTTFGLRLEKNEEPLAMKNPLRTADTCDQTCADQPLHGSCRIASIATFGLSDMYPWNADPGKTKKTFFCFVFSGIRAEKF